MDEFRLIERFFRRDSKSSEVVVGIGDDGAVVKTDTNEQTILVTCLLYTSPSPREPKLSGMPWCALKK